MSAISKKMAEKGKELSALKKAKKEESPEYKALENEMESLAAQMGGVVNSDRYKKNIKGLEEHSEAIAKIYDSPAFKKRIADAERSAKKAEAMVNSPEFKKRIADAERQAKIAERMMKSPKFQKDLKNAQEQAEKMQIRINSPEFQKMIQEAQKKAQEASEQYGKIYSEAEFEKMIKDQYGKDAFTDGTVRYFKDDYNFPESNITESFNFKFSDDNFFNEAKSKLSPKEVKKMEKKRKQLQAKQKELMEEQKKLQEKQRELNKEMRQNNPWTISFNSNLDSPKVLFYNKNFPPPQRISKSNQIVFLNNSLDNAKVYINGKEVDRDELKKVESNTISSMNVIKTNGTGKIEIITK